MINKDNKKIEDMLKNVKPMLPSRDFKNRVINEQKRIPIVETKPLNPFIIAIKRYALYLGCLLIVLASAVVYLGFYGENYYEIYLDINPSLEITVNRFGRVSKVKYINEDAQKYFGDMSFYGQKPEDVVEVIVDSLSTYGYFTDQSELYITGFSNKLDSVDEKVEAIYYMVNDIKDQNGYLVDIFTEDFDSYERDMAEKEQISPLKYKFITRLIELDDSYTREELKNYNMAELNKLYTLTLDILNYKNIVEAEDYDVSPLKYQLIDQLQNLTDLTVEVLYQMDTNTLKDLYQKAISDYSADMEAEIIIGAEFYDIDINKYAVIYLIVKSDSSYTVDGLKNKSIIELKTILYAVEKYEYIKDKLTDK